MKIFLIGMPGSGKTTVGKTLAKKLNFRFIDLDEEIEKQALMFIPEIFANYGEDYFRKLETNILAEQSEDNCIISCGGGIVCRDENLSLMQGKIIWLDVDVNDLIKRVENDNTDRPLLKNNTIYDLYQKRLTLYEKFSDIKILNQQIDETIKKIMELIK